MDVAGAKQVAAYLNDKKLSFLLEQLEKTSQEQRFYVPFMGQFSTGKSYLINSLLGMELLPVGILETTSALTKISDGEDNAYYITTEGNEQEISPEDLQRIRQGSVEYDFEKIKEIHLYIKNELLKKGLIIVDTPGLNTIIRRHEEFTYDILPAAGAVVYAMDKFLTEKDWLIIQDLLARDIPIALVRTQIDKIADDIGEVVKADQVQIAKYLGKATNVRYFAVSAKYPEITPRDTNSDWEALKKYLIHEIGDNMARICAATVKKRLEKIIAELSVELDKHKKKLEEQRELDAKTLQEKRTVFENALKALEISHKQQQYRLEQQIRDLKVRTKERLEKLADKSASDCQENLEAITEREELYQRGKGILLASGTAFAEKANTLLRDALTEAASDLPGKYAAEVRDVLQGNGIEDIFTGGSISYADADAIRDEIATKLQSEREELEDIEASSQQKIANIRSIEGQYQEGIAIAEDAANETQMAQTNVNDLVYQPIMVMESGSNAGSEWGRKIGGALEFALDVAMVVCSSGAAGAGKKAGEAIAKKTFKQALIETGKKIGNAALKVKAAGNMTGQRDGLWKALDYISPAYWGERIGRNFDEPPREVEDPEVRAAYEVQRRSLEQKYLQLRRKQLQREEAVGLIKSQLEKERREQELLQKEKAELEKQLRKKKQEMQENYIRKDCQNYRRKLQKEYRDGLAQLTDNLLRHWNLYLTNNLPVIVAAELKQIEDKIKRQDEDYRQLIASGDGRATKLQKLIDEQARFAKLLEA